MMRRFLEWRLDSRTRQRFWSFMVIVCGTGVFAYVIITFSPFDAAHKPIIALLGLLLVAFLTYRMVTEDKLLLPILSILLVALFCVFSIALFHDGFAKLIAWRLHREPGEAFEFMGIAMGGIVLTIQAAVAYRRAKAMEDTAKTTEQGLRQERLKNAIEHLGHHASSVRLGGAYELFHLAEDVKEWRETIFEILVSHIRETSSTNE